MFLRGNRGQRSKQKNQAGFQFGIKYRFSPDSEVTMESAHRDRLLALCRWGESTVRKRAVASAALTLSLRRLAEAPSLQTTHSLKSEDETQGKSCLSLFQRVLAYAAVMHLRSLVAYRTHIKHCRTALAVHLAHHLGFQHVQLHAPSDAY